MSYKEKETKLIKEFEVSKKTKVSYIINTILNIINRWDNVKVYIYNLEDEEDA